MAAATRFYTELHFLAPSTVVSWLESKSRSAASLLYFSLETNVNGEPAVGLPPTSSIRLPTGAEEEEAGSVCANIMVSIS